MPGLADIAAQVLLNDATGAVIGASSGNRYVALFSAAPTSGAGSDGTELSGTGYARVRVIGTVTVAGAFTTATTVLTLSATAPAWLTALGTPLQPGFGAQVWDQTVTGGGTLLGFVQSVSGTTLTLQAPALHASQGASDNLSICAFPLASPSTGAEPLVAPASMANIAQINFAQAGSNWGTAVAWGIFDAPTAGNCWFWDDLGPSPWYPATCNAANPTTINLPRNGFSVGQPLAFTSKPGGNFPTFSQSNFTNNVGTLTVNGGGTDSFTAINAGTVVGTSTTGSFFVRTVGLQAIPQNITAQFPPGSFALYAA